MRLLSAFAKSCSASRRLESFFYEDDVNDPDQAASFLLNLRDFVAQMPVPDGTHYVQMPHSDDTKIVGGDRKRPAILDASYPYFNSHLLSVSFPDFTPLSDPFSKISTFSYHLLQLKSRFGFASTGEKPVLKFGGDYIKINRGLSAPNIQAAFLTFLGNYGIEFQDGSTKVGHDRLSSTGYVEARLEHPERDYERGRAIIQTLIHGAQSSVEELRRDTDGVLKKPGNNFAGPGPGPQQSL